MRTSRPAFMAAAVAVALGSASCAESRRVRTDEAGENEGYAVVWELDFEPATRVDMLFVVDDSSTMEEEQEILADQVSTMVRELIAPEDSSSSVVYDLHLGVVSTDLGTGGHPIQTCSDSWVGDDGVIQGTGRLSGCEDTYTAPDCDRGQCGWLAHTLEHPDDGLDPANPPIWEDFGCVATLGTAGCGFEQPLEASYRALVENTRSGGPNEGFLRDDSLLFIVYVTDEDDCSTGNTEMFEPTRDDLGPLNTRCVLNPDELYPVSRYHDAFVDLRDGDEHRVVVAAIAGIPIDGSWDPGDPIERLRDLQQLDPQYPTSLLPSCDTAMGTAYPPVRIAELVYSFGNNGFLASICRSDWTPALQLIMSRVRPRFPPSPYCIDDVPEDPVERCRLVQTYVSDDPCPHPADADGPERTEGWQVDLGVRDVDEGYGLGVVSRRRCEILPADYDGDGCPDGASDCSARYPRDGLQGWFVSRTSRECWDTELRVTSTAVEEGSSDVTWECRL